MGPEVIGWTTHSSAERTEGERGEIKSSRERARASQSDRGRDTWCAISNQNIHRDRKYMEQDLKCTRANREDQITDRKNLQKPSKKSNDENGIQKHQRKKIETDRTANFLQWVWVSKCQRPSNARCSPSASV